MKSLPRMVALVVLLGCASCGLLWRGAGDRIRAPHDRHAQAKVECVVCHETIYDAKTLTGEFLPKEEVCLQCHREAKQQNRCSMCHTDVRRAGPWRAVSAQLKISHADHLAPTKEDCRTCHPSLPEPFRALAQRPTMAACTGCHEHKRDYDNGRCGKCHLDLTRFPLEPITSFSHLGDYVRNHAGDARAAADRCATCHESTFCADCHASTVSMKIEARLPERVNAAFIHRNDYVGRHAVDAQAEPAMCRRCHGSSFCESCHAAQNLTPLSANPRDPHPSVWSFPGSSSFHGSAARRDIASCAPCHDQGARSICVDCHKVGGVGGNPHPAGWQTQHGRDEIQRNGMCLSCHL
jgi:hypothetical protein